jgi:hypothetical protein
MVQEVLAASGVEDPGEAVRVVTVDLDRAVRDELSDVAVDRSARSVGSGG